MVKYKGQHIEYYIHGSLKEHYGKLWDYAEEIRRSNAGSTVKVGVEGGVDGNNYLKRFYVCFHILKEGWIAGLD